MTVLAVLLPVEVEGAEAGVRDGVCVVGWAAGEWDAGGWEGAVVVADGDDPPVGVVLGEGVGAVGVLDADQVAAVVVAERVCGAGSSTHPALEGPVSSVWLGVRLWRYCCGIGPGVPGVA